MGLLSVSKWNSPPCPYDTELKRDLPFDQIPWYANIFLWAFPTLLVGVKKKHGTKTICQLTTNLCMHFLYPPIFVWCKEDCLIGVGSSSMRYAQREDPVERNGSKDIFSRENSPLLLLKPTKQVRLKHVGTKRPAEHCHA